VTISGQFAGAGSVRALLVSPLAAGLYQGAITESGSSYTSSSGGTTLAEGEKLGIEFAKNKGASLIAELRAMSAAYLIAVDSTEPTISFPRLIDG
jgi:para-nitrobenzyl esterase